MEGGHIPINNQDLEVATEKSSSTPSLPFNRVQLVPSRLPLCWYRWFGQTQYPSTPVNCKDFKSENNK